jgi:polyisoprenoid-binding protein YceI
LIGWRVNHFGFNDYFGQFGNATGTLVLDKTTPANSRVDITIPINSLSAASPQLIQHMSGTDFFDVANHPTARFVSTRIIPDADDADEAVIEGTLTIKGISRPVRLEVDFTGAGANPMHGNKETVGFEAETTIRRSDFGIAYALPLVSDEVELTISVAFEK